MRKKEKAAFGCIAALLLTCLVSVGVAYVTGWLAHIKNAAVMPFKAQSLLNLAKEYPFDPPTGTGVAEERLQGYLEICCRVKPYADAVDAWEEGDRERPMGKNKEMKMEAAGLVAAFMNELAAALEEQQMGPTEFCWIEGRMGRAASGDPRTPDEFSDRELYLRHAHRIDACALGEHSMDIADDFAGN